ncbi:MAG: hypothetical protein S4CHLAM45_12190 [Chlamydiales bacterium]|nr:hypothetical protein [Chlamydiales bacterium]MCH9619708.1 hypothetical protein [Chlamydiales bacterium]MCH9623314.1 hypothetical protein [Chlamydiales bacterium]
MNGKNLDPNAFSHTQAYNAYIQVASDLRHNNHLQAFYRILASVWVFASLLAMGFLLSSHQLLPFINPFTTIFMVGFISFIVIGLIWYMDMIVVERSIAIDVTKGLELEKLYSWLPKFYHTVNKMYDLLGYVKLKTLFYTGYFSILSLTLGFVISHYFINEGQKIGVIITLFSSISAGVVFFYGLLSLSKKNEPYSQAALIRAPTQSGESPLKNRHGKNLIFGLYHNLNLFGTQYDTITAKYKNIALIWVLGISAVMFFLKSGQLNLPFNSITSTIVFCFIGIFGISVIWNLDINVYHRFWCAMYIQGNKMEKEHDFLLLSKHFNKKKEILSHGYLYISSNILLLIFAAILNIHSVWDKSVFLMPLTLLIYSLVLCVIAFYMAQPYQQIKSRFHHLLRYND